MSIYPVVMCGGSGTRLWPASRPNRPKQFVPLLGARSTFQETVARVQDLSRGGRLVVVTGTAHAAFVEAQLAEAGASAEILLEPEPRDSAAAMAAAAAWIAERDPDGVAVFVAADHYIPDAAAFRDAARVAVEGARAGRIVTLGVRPTQPSSAYGYIKPEFGPGPILDVASFVEKPDADTARGYVEAGYLWNSGNFVVSAQTLLGELDRFAPEVAASARRAVAESGGDDGLRRLSPSFLGAPKISIDYAVMERTSKASVLPIDLAWSDLGAWDAVWAVSDKDPAGNVAPPGAVLVDSEDCFVHAPGSSRVALVGTRNLTVVVDGADILVCDLGASQKVKAAAEAAGRAPPAGEPRRFDSLEAARDWYDTWLRSAALPLWWAIGADHRRGGFHELLSVRGAPVDAPRRCRVQARQAYVYAKAGAMDWAGDWRSAARHGYESLLTRYRRPDGLFRGLVDADGAVLDDAAALYDQAFCLLAGASMHQVDPDWRDLAGEGVRLREAIQALRHPAGGFKEAGAHPFQANAHMHLLEASLAWAEAGGDSGWDALADEIVELALRAFVDPASGTLLEFFDERWAPAPGEEGRLFEPGHQFEWAWLLERYARRRGRADAGATARRLFEAGLSGVDRRRGVAINAMALGGQVVDASARLWPQTEYIKAAVILGAEKATTLHAAEALAKYLDAPAAGAWRDKLRPDGTFVDEPAPASSFYHLMAACLELSGAR